MSLNGSYCSYSTNSWIEPEEASRLPFGEVVASCQFHDISKEKMNENCCGFPLFSPSLSRSRSLLLCLLNLFGSTHIGGFLIGLLPIDRDLIPAL